MKKILLKKSLFREFLNKGFIKKYKTSSLSYEKGEDIDIDVITYFQNFIRNFKETHFYKEMCFLLNEHKFYEFEEAKNNKKICKNCKKQLDVFSFIKLSHSNEICQCAKPNMDFNMYIFFNNLNLFCFNIFNAIEVWIKKIDYLDGIYLLSKTDLSNKYYYKSLLIYENNNLYCDVFNKIDCFKCGCFVLNDNYQTLPHLIILEIEEKNKNSKLVEEWQNCKKSVFIKHINEIQEKLNIKKLAKISDLEKINIFSFDNDKNYARFRRLRNILTHNDFYHLIQPKLLEYKNEDMLVNASLVLMIDYLLFFYFLLEQLGCIENDCKNDSSLIE